MLVVAVLLAAVLGSLLVKRSRREPLRRPADEVGPGPSPRPGGGVLERPLDRERAERAFPPVPEGLGARVRGLFSRGVDEQTWKDLEAALIKADVGAKGARAIVQRIRTSYDGGDPTAVVAREIAAAFAGDPAWEPPPGTPGIVMVVGVNGTGKTTTIGKLAYRLGREGRKVTVAASDTFRAAAGEQLETWAGRAGAHLVAAERGADPGSVAFDAVQSARARGDDVVIVDTAGRLHTREPLMNELRKVKRVLEKSGDRVGEVLLVLDATTGQNGIAQARTFAEAVGVTGVVLSKMDGTAKGGIVLAVREELGVPVKLVGVGEGVEDLVPFDPDAFARRLVA